MTGPVWRGVAAGAVIATLLAHPGCDDPKASPAGWTDWRGGPHRSALSDAVPARLPARCRYLWKRPLTGQAMAGVAATGRFVIVADKDAGETTDIWRCLAADTGRQVWSISYPAARDMDYTNSPRANPVIRDGLVYLLGAFGDLHCAELATGRIVWKMNILRRFGGELPVWGTCAAPAIAGDLLIVQPGAPAAAVVALDRRTGKVRWKAPGEPPGYACPIVGTFGGVRQVVIYGAASVAGLEVATGRRLWRLVPPEPNDFNVPTPVNVNGRLLLSTENNGTRLYEFDRHGRIRPAPVAVSTDLAPDASTPVAVGGLLFGCHGGLFCLDLNDRLKTLWAEQDDAYYDYASLIAGNGRVLITTVDGQLLLVRAEAQRYKLVSRLRIFTSGEVWSHPALVGNRLYVRGSEEIRCLLLD